MVDGHLVEGCIMAGLALWVEHWFPWRMLLGRELPRLASYVLGVLAMALPLTWVWWGQPAIYDLWAVLVCGGAAVVIAYLVDYGLRRLRMSFELQDLLRVRDATRETEEGMHE